MSFSNKRHFLGCFSIWEHSSFKIMLSTLSLSIFFLSTFKMQRLCRFESTPRKYCLDRQQLFSCNFCSQGELERGLFFFFFWLISATVRQHPHLAKVKGTICMRSTMTDKPSPPHKCNTAFIRQCSVLWIQLLQPGDSPDLLNPNPFPAVGGYT